MGRTRIEAAGVVLVRGDGDDAEVAVVHRARRKDWSLPKGKLDDGERHDVAAVREAWEETGVHCVLGPSLGSRKYVALGLPKRVRYWRATVLSDEGRLPDDEVDEIRWLRRDEAHGLLTYDDDHLLVDRALALPTTTATIVLRHAQATKRAAWRESGDPLAAIDAERSLTEVGGQQAVQLAPTIDAYAPTLVVSSDARRCRDTVAPYADLRGLETRLVHALSEEGYREDPGATVAAVDELLEAGGPAVWCTHRPVMGTMLGTLADRLGLHGAAGEPHPRLKPRLRPAAAVVLHRAADGSAVAVDRWDA